MEEQNEAFELGQSSHAAERNDHHDQASQNGLRDNSQDDYPEPTNTRYNYNGRDSRSPRRDDEGNQKRGRSDSRGRGSPRRSDERSPRSG